MTDLSIRECAAGWTVVRLQPEVLGTFAHRTHADLFVIALREWGGRPPLSRRRAKP